MRSNANQIECERDEARRGLQNANTKINSQRKEMQKMEETIASSKFKNHANDEKIKQSVEKLSKTTKTSEIQPGNDRLKTIKKIEYQKEVVRRTEEEFARLKREKKEREDKINQLAEKSIETTKTIGVQHLNIVKVFAKRETAKASDTVDEDDERKDGPAGPSSSNTEQQETKRGPKRAACDNGEGVSVKRGCGRPPKKKAA